MDRRSAAKSSQAGVGVEDTGWGRGVDLARSVIGMCEVFLLLVNQKLDVLGLGVDVDT